ncbi:hypothetical protein [Methylobacterium haplocladii]|uniref:Uncharacterized protein n=1 Tax=Methylobacterium haplocladii TaxID=1176176 RepID=A0A512IW28_9HYPH|nr:hypothetical protein [Methylobacterium haplocladii]GEP01921.1 hypothetical protein MHA02_43080 [Methylobacterium haplocladii]GJD86196.1 hypothetical protein HPGCJGGD_4093 [Methylobacterium haplocladii]GLS61234.1 hypothetical protein GCM10007887_39320 [Methylobacterium haplocladii]
MDRTYLRLFTSDGKLIEQQRSAPKRPIPSSPTTSSKFDVAVADANAVHDVVRRLQLAIMDGDKVAIRALARSAEFKAERAASAAEVLRDFYKRAAR